MRTSRWPACCGCRERGGSGRLQLFGAAGLGLDVGERVGIVRQRQDNGADVGLLPLMVASASATVSWGRGRASRTRSSSRKSIWRSHRPASSNPFLSRARGGGEALPFGLDSGGGAEAGQGGFQLGRADGGDANQMQGVEAAEAASMAFEGVEEVLAPAGLFRQLVAAPDGGAIAGFVNAVDAAALRSESRRSETARRFSSVVLPEPRRPISSVCWAPPSAALRASSSRKNSNSGRRVTRSILPRALISSARETPYPRGWRFRPSRLFFVRWRLPACGKTRFRWRNRQR